MHDYFILYLNYFSAAASTVSSTWQYVVIIIGYNVLYNIHSVKDNNVKLA